MHAFCVEYSVENSVFLWILKTKQTVHALWKHTVFTLYCTQNANTVWNTLEYSLTLTHTHTQNKANNACVLRKRACGIQKASSSVAHAPFRACGIQRATGLLKVSSEYEHTHTHTYMTKQTMHAFCEKERVEYRELLAYCEISFTSGDHRTRNFVSCVAVCCSVLQCVAVWCSAL